MEKKSFSVNLPFDRQTILTTLFIGVAYLWTSNAYLTWSNHLAPLAEDGLTYLATEAGGCITQFFGILLFSWLLRRDLNSVTKNRVVICAMILDGLSILPVAFSDEMMSVLLGGLVMNLFHGIIAACYIARLSCCIPKNRRGFCFGGGYAFGNIGCYLLSLLNGGDFLSTRAVWFVHVFFILVCILLAVLMERADSPSDAGDKFPAAIPARGETESPHVAAHSVPLSTCVLAGMVIIFLGMTTQVLFFFPAMAYVSNTSMLDFSHLFYAVGLVIAACVNDKKRSAGFVLALLSLCFPLLSISLYQLPHMLVVLAVAGYIVTGFLSVYRIVVFADLYDADGRLLFLAPAGLLCGRIGEAAGACIGYVIGSRHIILTIVTALFFITSIILFYILYVLLYSARPATTFEERADRFRAQYGFSAKEHPVFLLLVEGKSNKEIANELFISENTVKFHVRNILKKTDCRSRTDVARKFQMFV